MVLELMRVCSLCKTEPVSARAIAVHLLNPSESDRTLLFKICTLKEQRTGFYKLQCPCAGVSGCGCGTGSKFACSQCPISSCPRRFVLCTSFIFSSPSLPVLFPQSSLSITVRVINSLGRGGIFSFLHCVSCADLRGAVLALGQVK